MNRNNVICLDNTDEDNPIRLGSFYFSDISEGDVVEVNGQDWSVSDVIYVKKENMNYAYLEQM